MSKSSSRSSTRGFTLVEMLVSSTLTLALGAATLALMTSARTLFDLDRERTRVNQSVKSARDFLGLDVRQAGERLPPDFPALEIVRGEDLPGGAAGDPDRLILRRNLVTTVMRSCRDVSGTERKLYIAELQNPPPPGCVAVPDDDGDGWPDNHRIWRDHRVANGIMLGRAKYVWAYIYNPVTRDGEFFRYWRDSKAQAFLKTPTGQSWQFSYPVNQQARIYLLEERRYQLNGDTAQVVINRVDADSVNIASDMVDFQILAHYTTGPPTDLLGASSAWSNLRGIEIALHSLRMYRGRPVEQRLTTILTPRNVLSK
ncbi:MAG: hypothetical protein GY716_08380 [bacterium]|nr:hypothetical protein [bacterium]